MKQSAEFALCACEGKERLAPSIAKQIAKRMKRRGKAVDAYRCTVCGHWHIGGLTK